MATEQGNLAFTLLFRSYKFTIKVSELEEAEEDVQANQSSAKKMEWLNEMKKEALEKVNYVLQSAIKRK